MKWPTWDQAAVAAALSGLVALVITRWGRRHPLGRGAVFTESAGREFALVAGLYSLWRVARSLPLAQNDGAIERARQIDHLQHVLHFPSELSLQHFVLRHDTVARLTSLYYATLHVPALIGFLIWLFVRHRDKYPHWRNGLVFLTACCLVIRFVRVAPPRFLGDLGYVDLATRLGYPTLYGPVGTGVSDQFAAMPSIHVGWAAVVSFGIVAASTSRWRWLALLHVVLTALVVSASGNHWWLDGIVAVALLGVGLVLDRLMRSWRDDRPGAGSTLGRSKSAGGAQTEPELMSA